MCGINLKNFSFRRMPWRIMKNKKHFDEFYSMTEDIFELPEFKNLKTIPHHGKELYSHSVAVGYYSYLWAKSWGRDYCSAARAGLLHDFTKEYWKNREIHLTGLDRIKAMHGLSHPKTALNLSREFFDINKREEDIIVKHMWPLTVVPPKYTESWMVSFVDKGVAILEMVKEHTPRKLYRKHVLAGAQSMV